MKTATQQTQNYTVVQNSSNGPDVRVSVHR